MHGRYWEGNLSNSENSNKKVDQQFNPKRPLRDLVNLIPWSAYHFILPFLFCSICSLSDLIASLVNTLFFLSFLGQPIRPNLKHSTCPFFSLSCISGSYVTTILASNSSLVVCHSATYQTGSLWSPCKDRRVWQCSWDVSRLTTTLYRTSLTE